MSDYLPIEHPQLLEDLTKRKEFYQYSISNSEDPFLNYKKYDFQISKFMLSRLEEEDVSLNLKSYQSMIRNFMEPNKPYKRLLAKWDPGMGKTIATIDIAMRYIKLYERESEVENDIDDNLGTVYIIGFTAEIYKKELLNYPAYGYISRDELRQLKQLEENADSSNKTDIDRYQEFKTKLRKRLTSRKDGGYFKFIGYKEFVNRIFNLENFKLNINDMDETEIIQALKDGSLQWNKPLLDSFGRNSIVICDEIHNTYNSLEKNNWGIALQMVFDHHSTLKVIYNSATPINNSPTEIIDLANLLLSKDQKIIKNDFFNIQTGELLPGALEKISDIFRGRVSFVQDTNPKYFAKQIFMGETIKGIDYLKFIRVPMSKFHYNTYKECYTGALSQDAQYLVDLALPNPENANLGLYKTGDIKRLLWNVDEKWVNKNGFKIIEDVIIGPGFVKEKIGEYSMKNKELIDLALSLLKPNKGKVFIFHPVVHISGVLFIEQLLLNNGIIGPDQNETNDTLCSICGITKKDHDLVKKGAAPKKIIKTKKYALVTLMMKGTDYLPGCIALAKSFKHYCVDSDNIDLICMVTPDSMSATNELKKVFDRVVMVDYIEQNTVPLRTINQQKRYEKWIQSSYTKWNCLMFTEYSKILFVDADIICNSDITELFELNTPAGVFSCPWSKEFDNNSNIFDYYNNGKDTENNEIVKSDLIKKSLNNAHVVWGALVLLEPQKGDLDRYKEFITKMGPQYGYKNCNSGCDEQSITDFYVDQSKDWYFINQRYISIPWKNNWISGEAKMYHYISPEKPWMMEENKWPDLKIWWNMYNLHIPKFGGNIDKEYTFSGPLKPFYILINSQTLEPNLEYDIIVAYKGDKEMGFIEIEKIDPNELYSDNFVHELVGPLNVQIALINFIKREIRGTIYVTLAPEDPLLKLYKNNDFTMTSKCDSTSIELEYFDRSILSKKGGSIDTYESHDYIPARYIIAHSDMDKSTMQKHIDKFNSVNNLWGYTYKYLIGSKIIKESYNTKAIQHTIITGRPDNIPTLLQILGRSRRNEGHKLLPPEYRFIRIYMLVSSIPGFKELSHEEVKYKEKIQDYKMIQKIEKVLHENAIDGIIAYNIIEPGLDKTNSSLGPLYYKPNQSLKNYKLSDLNLATFNIFHTQEEINQIIYIIKRLYVEWSNVFTLDELWKMVQKPHFHIEINTTLFQKEYFIIALNALIYQETKKYVRPNISENKQENIDKLFLLDLLHNNVDKRIIMHDSNIGYIHYIDQYYIFIPYKDGRNMVFVEAPFRQNILSKNKPINIYKYLKESSNNINYDSKRLKFKAKFENIPLEKLATVVGKFGTQFHMLFVEELIVYVFNLWTNPTVTSKSEMHDFYFKMLYYYDIMQLIAWGSEIKDFIREMYKDYLLPINNNNIIVDPEAASISSSLSKSHHDEFIKISKEEYFKTLNLSINVLASRSSSKSIDKKINDINVPKIVKADPTLLPVGHFMHSIPKFYRPDKGWFESPEYIQQRQDFKENDKIIGYYEKSSTGLRIKFKIRSPLQHIEKHQDTRLIEKGSICTSNSKQELYEIAEKLGIKLDDKINVPNLCNEIESKLLTNELIERKNKTNIKWFYSFWENRLDERGQNSSSPII